MDARAQRLSVPRPYCRDFRASETRKQFHVSDDIFRGFIKLLLVLMCMSYMNLLYLKIEAFFVARCHGISLD